MATRKCAIMIGRLNRDLVPGDVAERLFGLFPSGQ
jgi:hypothetical protein